MKQAFSVWQAAPPEAYRHEDVTAEAAERFAANQVVDVVDTTGTPVAGSIVTATVDVVDGEPFRAVALLDLPNGTRTIAVSFEPDLASNLIDRDPIGSPVTVAADGTFALGR